MQQGHQCSRSRTIKLIQMKAIKREVNKKGHIILTCEEEKKISRFLRKPRIEKVETQFIATEEFPKGYWKWRLLPDKTLISDNLCFQLDAWNKDFD